MSNKLKKKGKSTRELLLNVEFKFNIEKYNLKKSQ